MTKKKAKPVGLPPGSLHLNVKAAPATISILDYSRTDCKVKQEASLDECMQALATPMTTWIHVTGIGDPQSIAAIGKHFGLHPLVVEDILTPGQRSKIDDYGQYIFIIVSVVKYNLETHSLEDSQVSFVFGKNYLISFAEQPIEILDSLRKRICERGHRISEEGPDYLAYAILDIIVDQYFVVLESVDSVIDQLQEEVINDPTPKILYAVQKAKRNTALLRKVVWPMREVISHFRRLETPLIKGTTNVYMHDVYDHTIQIIDTIEGFRDNSSTLLEVYMSNITQRMTEAIKVLTVVATIFAPLTFITGVYGMNFTHMPELQWKWGYLTSLILMGLSAIGMLYYFRKKKWI